MAFKTKKNNKTLKCKSCGEKVESVGEDTVAVTCWKCVNKSLTSPVKCQVPEEN